MSEVLEGEEFSYKGIGSEGTGEKESNQEITLELFEPESTYAVDGCFLLILPRITLDSNILAPFLSVESKLTSRLANLTTKLPEGEEVISYAGKLIKEVERLSLRRITIIAREDGANIAQALCLLDPKLFRRAVLIDPRSRMHPSFFEQIVDKLESYLPVGLPFRASTTGFNSRPFLHRIRCPILVLISKNASLFSQTESEYIGRKIPNCYLRRLESGEYFSEGKGFSDEYLRLMLEFGETSPKRPQKNR